MARNIKYAGIHFHRHDDAGIASVSVHNNTQGTDVLFNELVDLYHADYDDTAEEYEDFIYKILLDPAEDDYTVTAEHSGSSNSAATGPDYKVEIERYLMSEELEEGVVNAQLILWHTDFPSHSYSFDVTPEVTTEIVKEAWYNGDGIATVFTLPSTSHAYQFVEFSVDGGVTWELDTSILLEWGSNNPDFDNEIISSTGNFLINFFTAPITGVNNIGIRYIPMTNKYKVVRTFKQPNDGAGFVDHTSELRLLDDAIELI